MQDKFENNENHYSTNIKTLNNAENKVKRKAIQYLKLCLELRFITVFIIVDTLFNYYRDVFGNFY